MDYKKYLQTNEARSGLDQLEADNRIWDAIHKDIVHKWDKDYRRQEGGIDGVPTSQMKKDIEAIVRKHARGWDRKKIEMAIYNYYSSLTGEYR